MRLFIAAALPLAALAACAQDDGNNTAAQEAEVGAPTTDPATTDLNLEASAGDTDQAVNQLDQQSNLDQALEDAGNGASNTVQ